MSVISFLNDLGIIPNEGTGLEKDANLLQGQKYMEYGRMYAKSVNNNLTHLQETSSPKVHSVIEALHGMDSLKKSTISASTDTSSAENEFNKTMSEYSSTYKVLSTDLMKKQNDKNFKINPALFQKLDKLNNKLISLSSKIGKEVHSSSSSHNTSNIKDQIKTKHKELQQHIEQINKHHRPRNEDYDATLDGQKESTELNSVSNYYFYLFWLIFSILLVTTTANVLMNNSGDNNSVLIIVLIIILIGVYFFNRA